VTDAITDADRREQNARASTASNTGDGGRLLASAVSYNALFSAISGVTLSAGAPLLSGQIGLSTWILVTLGTGLVGFAALLLLLLADADRLARGAPFVVAADVAWVVAAAVLLVAVPNLLAPAGQVSLVAVSVVVAVLAAAQTLGLRRRGTRPMTAASPVHLQVERIVAAPPDQVWAAISDAGDYGRFAPGIAHTAIVSGEQEGMVRVCRDDQGGEWAETCTLWEDGHRYRMTVDVSSYPTYYRWLLEEFAQTWTVEPASTGTRLRLAFDGAVKLGVFGRAAVRMLGRQRRLDAILENYERELTGAAGTGERGATGVRDSHHTSYDPPGAPRNPNGT
jgi:uncharacterized protein YndB with AHSA1/START domain